MKSEKGQSMVEFALILPILVMLLFAIVDFGRAFHVYLTLDHTGREIARLMSIGSDEATIDSKITSTTSSLDTTNKLTIIFPNGKTGLASGSEAKIVLNYKFSFITPLVSLLDKLFDTKISEYSITDTTVMRVE
ncbi:TadE/TadG family type IV pilus assembly protein [Neobacillus niacini]|uniref:TadE/TadG family type IV pilus assembly protein n=1 Tax=Neobacillus niacini TaxID=86668 RepID=UPI0021CB0676|nr:TadE family protein [Neobacillus niacini]MCM3765807.1 pilus assembly protein [Neobacillus niacini]